MWSGYVQLPSSPAQGLAKEDYLEGQVISQEGLVSLPWRNTLLYKFKSRCGDQTLARRGIYFAAAVKAAVFCMSPLTWLHPPFSTAGIP